METSTDCGRFNPVTYHQINNDISRPLAMYSESARFFMYFCMLLPADAPKRRHSDVFFSRSANRWNRTSSGLAYPDKKASCRKSHEYNVHCLKLFQMEKISMTLSLGLKSDTFYDGVFRLCSCLKSSGKKNAYVASETNKLEGQRQQLYTTLHYKLAVEDITAETKALRRSGAALRRQIRWWMQYGNAEEQACASRLMDIANEYGPFNRLTVRDCRTTAEMLLRDFGTEQAMADIAALNGVQDVVSQLDSSLANLREKQASVDAAIAAAVKPEALLEQKRGIANTVYDIMIYLVAMANEQPDVFGTLLDQMATILNDANAHKRKAKRLMVVPTDNVAEVPA